jgi:hypothetical protein
MKARIQTVLVTLATGVALAAPQLLAPLAAQAKAPVFEVDKLWPMPLPNHWVYGSITGLAIDSRDHVFVATRPASVAPGNEAGLMSNPPTAEYCCLAAPPILEFDANGALVASWGGPGTGYDWPTSTGGIAVDDKGNIWITAAGVPEPAAAAAGATGVVPGAARAGGAAAPAAGGAATGGGAAAGAGGRAGGRGETVIPGAEGAPVAAAPGRGGAAGPAAPGDAHILKFTRDGKFLMQIGKAGESSMDSKTTLDKPADVAIDGTELYVADGGTHQRVVVFDAASGAFKRQWTGHGANFQRISTIAVSKDGLVYVGDRKANKVQIFKKDGSFVKELEVAKGTLVNGSVWDIGFSNDAKQTWMFVADGQNSTVRVFSRETLTPAGTIGDGGRWPGRFYAVNNVAMDSKGNLYTGEGYEGKRVQKFVKK